MTEGPEASAEDLGKEITIDVKGKKVSGTLHTPEDAQGLVLFVHGSGSSRFSPRNRFVAKVMQDAGLATLLFDLLTEEEEARDQVTRELRFDIDFLADRLDAVAAWTREDDRTRDLPVGYFGSSTGAAAALVAAARRPERVTTVVSRGGRPDLAGDALPDVKAPTLLLVGALDTPVIGMNEDAKQRMACPVALEIVKGASHLFEEPGKLEEAAKRARDWFVEKLGRAETTKTA